MSRSTRGVRNRGARKLPPVVGMISLGCPKNLVDSEAMLAALGTAGFAVSADASDCDVLIVNTCGFIAPAKAEAVATIREMSQHKRGRCRALIAAGCLAQDWAASMLVRLPELDGVVGTGETGRIVEVVRAAMAGERPVAVGLPGGALGRGPRLLTTPGHYAYLKIAEGCSTACSFCSIPRLRGRQVSREIEDVVGEARDLVDLGVRELIIVAQDTGAYGVDLGIEHALARLLERLAVIDGVDWLRVMYLNPSWVTAELAGVMGGVRAVCGYVDLPVQHGGDRILRSMGREGRDEILRAVERIRGAMADPALRSSLLVGFPGESEEDVAELVDLLERVEFDHVGMFRFSPQPGTGAARLEGRPLPAVADSRIEALAKVQRDIAARRARRWVGDVVTAVVEEVSDKTVIGRTEFQAPEIDPQTMICGSGVGPGDVVSVRVTDAGEWGLKCRVEG